MTYNTGTEPSAVVVGDFRGNGKLDLAVTNLASSNVSVLLGNGNGTFQAAVNYPMSSNPRWLAVGRFRGSQSPLDLAVVNHGDFSTTSSVSILLGNGDGTFRAGPNYTVGQDSDAESVAVGDFRGSGKLDLAVADYRSGTVTILLGNGDGTFQMGGTVSAGSNPLSVVAADFNGDGKLDLVVANRFSNTVSVLLGNGNGTFQSAVSYNAGTEPFALAVGHLRGGQSPLDLAVVSRSGNTVSVLLGTGTGGFQAPVSYATGISPWSVAVADFDRDGRADLVVANRGGFADNGTISVLLGNGNGTFQNAVNTDTGGQQPFSVAVGDFNGDGAPDVVVANRNSNNVGVLLNQQGATHFALTAPANATAGAPFSVTLTALTASGTVDANYRGTVSFTSTDGQATLPVIYSFTAADAGVHTFANGVVLRTAGSRTVTARDTTMATITGSATAAVAPAAASVLTLTGLSMGVTAGDSQSVTVTLRDPYNNVATGYRGTVAFGSDDGQASLPANYPFTAADAGVHTFMNGVVLRTAGSRTVTARDTTAANLTGSASTAVAPAAASVLTLAGLPAAVTAGDRQSVTVTLRDPYNNIATGYRGTVAFGSSDGQATLPPNYPFTAADAGVHTFANGVILRTAGNQTITVRDTVTATITGSAGTTVAPGALDHFRVLASANTVAAGTPFDVTVTAQDAFSNTVSGYTGTVMFSSGDPAGATLPGNYTFTVGSGGDNGVHTFPGGAALYTAGTWDVTATDVRSGAIGHANVNVTAAGADHFLVSTAADTVVAGTPFDFTVTVQDAYNNTVTGYTGTVNFSSADPYGATLPGAYTFTTGSGGDNGVHTFPGGATLYTAGTWDVTATDASNPAVAGSALVNVLPAPAVSFVVSAPGTATAGVPFDFSVTATDPYGNTDVAYTGTVVFSTMDPAGAFSPAGYTFQAADQGMAVFPQGATLNTVGTWDVTATDVSDPTITGSAFVNVTAGPGAGSRHRSRSAQARADEKTFSSLAILPSPGMGSMTAEDMGQRGRALGLPNHALAADRSLIPAPAPTSWEGSLLDQVFCSLTGTVPWPAAFGVRAQRIPGTDRDPVLLPIDGAWLPGSFPR